MKPVSLFEKYYQQGTSCLLESASFHTKTGRYSIIATQPEFIFKSWGNIIQIGDKIFAGDPLGELKKIFQERRIEYNPDLPPFTGGAIGYIGYDTVRLWEDIGNNAEKDIDIPDIYLLFYNDVTMSEARPRTWQMSEDRPRTWGNRFRPNISKEVFIDMVLKAKEYIRAGDIYQANLSQRLIAENDNSGWTIYKRLREINPSPFAGYMDLGDLQLISCSPERLVKLEGSLIQTRPIAGTYPRGKTIMEDINLAQQLILHPKERAEHIMLVDLERNDLGRVCRYGSVKVDELIVVESYSHVHHIVSNICGLISDGIDQIDVLKAVFPGGTITGCPKIRCMQIIDELEPVRRNVYTGSMGWIGYNGNMDLNIIIRTILKIGNKLYLQVGAGIVADSVPEREYNETLYKAGALMEAVNGRGDASAIRGEYGFDSLSKR